MGPKRFWSQNSSLLIVKFKKLGFSALLGRCCRFSALIYCSWWFSCDSAVDAPFNNLQFYKFILQYAEIDEAVSNSAKIAFQCHLWYLTPEMIPLSLFSDLVASLKDELAKKLLSVQPNFPVITPSGRHGTGFGKPIFSSILDAATTLTDLITRVHQTPLGFWILMSMSSNVTLLGGSVHTKKLIKLEVILGSRRSILCFAAISDGALRNLINIFDFIAFLVKPSHVISE